MTDANSITFFGPPAPGERRPFSRAARAGGLVFISGHSAPHDPARGIHRGDTPQEQVRNAQADYAACNEEYVKHFPNGLPARHTARFGVPTDAKVAFACIALVK
jgi:2-iminobutanoate/2-iminopropanoate deaminase